MPWPRELMRRGENDDDDAVRPAETSWSQHLREIPRFRRLPQPAETFRNCRNEPWNARLYAIKLRMTEGISAGLFRLNVQTIPLHPENGYWKSFVFRIGKRFFFLEEERLGYSNSIRVFNVGSLFFIFKVILLDFSKDTSDMRNCCYIAFFLEILIVCCRSMAQPYCAEQLDR